MQSRNLYIHVPTDVSKNFTNYRSSDSNNSIPFCNSLADFGNCTYRYATIAMKFFQIAIAHHDLLSYMYISFKCLMHSLATLFPFGFSLQCQLPKISTIVSCSPICLCMYKLIWNTIGPKSFLLILLLYCH